MALTSQQVKEPVAYRWGSLALFLALSTIVAALAFEHVGGHVPCPLCLQQRYVYYAGVPALFGALVLVSAGMGRASALVFLLVALAFLVNAGLGVHQAGVEWSWWEGPTTCSGALQPLGGASGGILGRIGEAPVIRCDQASWRFSGLSFAGWNAVISATVAVAAATACFHSRRPPLEVD